MALPPLREELALLSGPALADGQPSWTLHDPVRNQFFRIDWQTFEILSRWELGDSAAIVLDMQSATTLHPDVEDVDALIKFLGDNQLLRQVGADHTLQLTARLSAIRGSWKQWLLHHYLFFRVPLVRPDGWLTKTAKHVSLFFTPLFFKLTVAAFLLGLIEVARDWERFQATLVDMISWQGFVAYSIALVFVKVLHELGHAYTAKRYGCRVPAMGVAFLVLWPVAYTDTNDVWKLTDRHQRLQVAAAGVLTELTVAAWATLAWALLPEGGPKSIAFILATSTWLSTIAINASPFMRFDGYFFLVDWLDMPNLHSRSFALARWNMRERLFGLGEPPPEYFSPRRTSGLILFAYATWLYRLILFLGIAVLVYTFFIKAVGIFLFIVEIGWFVILPLWQELKVWRQLWPAIKGRARTKRSMMWGAVLLMLTVLPWPARVVTSGMLKPEKSFTVYAPAGAQLVSFSWKDGAIIPAGESILTLAAPELTMRWDRANAHLNRAQKQLAAGGVDALQRANLQVLQQELVAAQVELAQVKTDLTQFAPTAPFTGVLRDVDPDLRPGVWVGNREKLATLLSQDRWLVETYLDEEEVRRIHVGDGALFISDGRAKPALTLKVRAVDQDATRIMPSGMLTVPAGGNIMVREKHGQLIPDKASYRVVLAVEGDAETLANESWRGQVIIRGNWEAPAMRYIRSALVLIWREAGA